MNSLICTTLMRDKAAGQTAELVAPPTVRAALYARVSSERQRDEATIDSQLEAVRRRMAEDGVKVRDDLCFVDDGYSGGTLSRPALEKLRDAVAFGRVEVVYAYAPDRLSRQYAYLFILIQEWQDAGVETRFVHGKFGESPEERMLLQMQGMIAEYERAKIVERTRRGARYAARQGRVSVFGKAPYGYRYVARHEGDGEARFDVVLDQAEIVRQIFAWVGQDRLSLGEVRRRLAQRGAPSPTGRPRWDRASIYDLLRNPAYKGQAAYGRTRCGERRRTPLRTLWSQPAWPRRIRTLYPVASEDWIVIPVPALIGEALFEAVGEQLAENRIRHRRQKECGHGYLLAGLLVCAECRHGLSGKAPGASGGRARARYYVCNGRERSRSNGDEKPCANPSLRTSELDEAVWADVRALLNEPARVEQEYHRRRNRPEPAGVSGGEHPLLKQILYVRKQESRLIDGWQHGLLEREDLETRLRAVRQRLSQLESQVQAARDEASQRHELRLAMGELEDFAARVRAGLTQADEPARQEIIRKLVKRIEVGQQEVTIVYRAGPASHIAGLEAKGDRERTSHCCVRAVAPSGQADAIQET